MTAKSREHHSSASALNFPLLKKGPAVETGLWKPRCKWWQYLYSLCPGNTTSDLRFLVVFIGCVIFLKIPQIVGVSAFMENNCVSTHCSYMGSSEETNPTVLWQLASQTQINWKPEILFNIIIFFSDAKLWLLRILKMELWTFPDSGRE